MIMLLNHSVILFIVLHFSYKGDITLNTGFWKTRLKKPALYFKTPCQVVSWTKPERWLKEYFIVFTKISCSTTRHLQTLSLNCLFKLEKAIPFELEPDEIELLNRFVYPDIKGIQSDNSDKFELIASYTHTLLIHIRRMYIKYAEIDTALTAHIHQHDHSLVEEFRVLIRKIFFQVTGKITTAP